MTRTRFAGASPTRRYRSLRPALAAVLALLAFAGALPFHEHGARLGEPEGLRDRTLFTAAVHPRAPHHVEATQYVEERSCPACLSSLQSSGVRAPQSGALPVLTLSAVRYSRASFALSDTVLTPSSARGPPTA